jgi:hypothetical protein
MRLLGRGSTAIATCLVYLVLTSTAAGQEGWSLKKLNPFQREDASKKRASASVSDSGSKMRLPRIKVPSLKMPFSGSKANKGPSGIQKLSAGTKKAISKTSNALQPWKKNKPASAPQFRTTITKSKEKKSSPFAWMLPGSKEPKKQARTPNEFLALPRP